MTSIGSIYKPEQLQSTPCEISQEKMIQIKANPLKNYGVIERLFDSIKDRFCGTNEVEAKEALHTLALADYLFSNRMPSRGAVGEYPNFGITPEKVCLAFDKLQELAGQSFKADFTKVEHDTKHFGGMLTTKYSIGLDNGKEVSFRFAPAESAPDDVVIPDDEVNFSDKNVTFPPTMTEIITNYA
ncbi:hypothetical protein [Shewanella surugensis]|uniref:Uncharacterized protein n=1 Tax=Shewanella surugensis TaxID=212020 RepID=A0ABT0L9F6_9GAMM|nr:hypothetical protein [Shewanella surugensis]MCL1124327.1 hypothetical protein [Shewanella surugensis]